MRCFLLRPSCYQSLLDSFSSKALNLEKLNQLWLKLCLKLFKPVFVCGRMVLACDGIKAPKEGRKMPGVKLCHQQSSNNSKPEYVMAHSMQMVALMVEGIGQKISAILLVARIHEGVIFSNRDQRTLLDKLSIMISQLVTVNEKGPLVVCDAYYASASLLKSMIAQGGVMLVRVRNNAVGYAQAESKKKAGRGRPKKYGKSIGIAKQFKERAAEFQVIDSPIRDENNIKVRYLVLDLLWKQYQDLVRFILVDHPTRGKMILMTNEWEMLPSEAIRTYHARFGIEMSFKALIHTVGGFAYHFWMKEMKKIRRWNRGQYMHREPKKYREKVKQKLNTYHAYINLAAIAQGLLSYLAIHHSKKVWLSFGSWMRTIRMDLAPSESVAAEALKNSFLEFLHSTDDPLSFKKFLARKVDLGRMFGHLSDAA